ncbi:heme-dependent catalase, partial [Massarina eburnea CBS 473.64]
LRWDAPGVETIAPNEATQISQIQTIMQRMQEHNYTLHGHAFRATHVKTQGIVKGEVKVHEDLPPHLRQGVFGEPGRVYDVVARYANEAYLLQRDGERGPRGLGVKVFGVRGERLDGEDGKDGGEIGTQDFLFNNSPSIELTDIPTTLDIMGLRDQHFDDPEALRRALQSRSDARKQNAPYNLPNTDIISHAMFTQSAFRFGEWYGHMGLFPVVEEQKVRGAVEVGRGDGAGVLRDWLEGFFLGGCEAVYEFKIQLGTDPTHHPTEDGSVIWDETTSPYQTLGTLTFPPQNSFSHERRVFWEERMSLDPWRGLVAHRPLGGINRLRKGVYAHSRKVRDGINVSEARDVRGVDEIP